MKISMIALIIFYVMCANTSFAKNVYVFQADKELCSIQKDSFQCKHIENCYKECKVLDIRKLSDTVYEHYHFKNDFHELWINSVDKINDSWSGNCTNLTITMLQFMYNSGIPADNLWRVIVDTGSGQHMVGIVKNTDGKMYVIGDTDKRYPYLIDELRQYNIVYSSRLDQGMQWESTTFYNFTKN